MYGKRTYFIEENPYPTLPITSLSSHYPRPSRYLDYNGLNHSHRKEEQKDKEQVYWKKISWARKGEEFSKRLTKKEGVRAKRNFPSMIFRKKIARSPKGFYELVDTNRVGSLALDLVGVIRKRGTKHKL